MKDLIIGKIGVLICLFGLPILGIIIFVNDPSLMRTGQGAAALLLLSLGEIISLIHLYGHNTVIVTPRSR